ncbi:putative molluscan insulin-related peptide(s) receptor [Epargyreus clarus]|uniref:putative molluscan insulin-related peptide(s) receptor n=1 Tax=Epargyreus clarus TaxID=520877 RepID=UPI003C2C0983
MAPAKAVAWLILISIIDLVASQKQVASFEYRKICRSIHCKSIPELMKLRNCTVVLGTVTITLESTTKEDFRNISFPELREVTGYMIVYRVFGLASVGNLFPNLVRVRGETLVSNFALIIYEVPHLVDIGLYNLLKVDRGGVILYGGVSTCYMDSINWELITNGRHVILSTDTFPYCNNVCRCSPNAAANFCWNNKKCQRFLEGPEAEECHDQCFGCRKTNASRCSLCRNYTYKGQCLPECPNGTIVIAINKYCVTENECKELGGWSWKNFCTFDCPQNYIKWDTPTGTTCTRCDTCKKTCQSLYLQTIQFIQLAENCVYINGSLTIHIRSFLPQELEEMRRYLSGIQEVSDYVFIYGSITVTSFDFLPSLKKIGGNNLYDGKYSLVVAAMPNLQMLFPPNVTDNLDVHNGTVSFHNNPVLCMNQIDKLKERFPISPSELDIPHGLNGYSGGCNEVSLKLNVKVKNETFAVVSFNRLDKNTSYSILYVRIPVGEQSTIVPEGCSDSDWHVINIPSSKLKNGRVYIDMPSLRPASSYALCIESYTPIPLRLARSSIVNFDTAVGKPEPPFITELVAASSQAVVIRWVDHVDYRSHIDHYELVVSIIEITAENIAARDHCVKVVEDSEDTDYSRHAVVMRPPKNYEKGCESMCGILSTVTVGAMAEDYFDICSTLQSGCDEHDDSIHLTNSSFGIYISTLVLNISIPRSYYEIEKLAPFRDYRFKLRACTKNKCSRFSSSSVRTLRLNGADIPHITSVIARDSGDIYLRWRPPKVTNGPILAYYVEILPVLPDMEHLVPRIWCIPGNITDLIINFYTAKQYYVRICSKTLGSDYVCSNHRAVAVTSDPKWWWMGFPFAMIIYIGSIITGWMVKIDRRSDEISLVDMTSLYRNESEPPNKVISDPTPLYPPLGEIDLLSLE